MLGEFTQVLIDAIRTHGLLAVVVGVIIETVIVPIPSPLILMTAGAVLITADSIALALGHAFVIALVAGLAQTIGSYLVYGVGYFGGKPIMEKFEKFHGVSWKEIQMFQKKFKGKREWLTLLLLRALPIMPLSVVSGVAGVIKVNWKPFTVYTFLGTVPRNLILAILGWSMQEVYVSMAGHIDHAETIMTMLIVLMICAYIVAHKLGIIKYARKKVL